LFIALRMFRRYPAMAGKPMFGNDMPSKDNILCNRGLFIETLSVYTSHPKLSFVDCYLDVFARSTNTAPLLTFDKKMGSQLFGTKLLLP